MNSIGIAIKSRNMRKRVMFSLLEQGNSAVLGNRIDLASISASQELREALEESVKFKNEGAEISGSVFEKKSRKRLTEFPVDDKTNTLISQGRDKSFHLTHLVAIYGDTYELIDFLAYVQTIYHIEDIESILIMVMNDQPEPKYEWVVYTHNEDPIKFSYVDPEAAYSLSVFRKIIDGKIKGKIITSKDDKEEGIEPETQENEGAAETTEPFSESSESEVTAEEDNSDLDNHGVNYLDNSITDGPGKDVIVQSVKKKQAQEKTEPDQDPIEKVSELPKKTVQSEQLPRKKNRVTVGKKQADKRRDRAGSDVVTSDKTTIKAGQSAADEPTEENKVIEEATKSKIEDHIDDSLFSNEVTDNLFQDDLAGIVYFLSGGNVFKVSVSVKLGTGQVLNHGFKTRKDVLEYVKNAYLQFREAKSTVSDKIDCRAYDYSIQYECLTGLHTTTELSLPTFIGMCSANLQKPVRRKVLIVQGDDIDDMMLEVLQKVIPGGANIFLLSGQSSVSAGAEVQTYYYDTWPDAVKLAIVGL